MEVLHRFTGLLLILVACAFLCLLWQLADGPPAGIEDFDVQGECDPKDPQSCQSSSPVSSTAVLAHVQNASASKERAALICNAGHTCKLTTADFANRVESQFYRVDTVKVDKQGEMSDILRQRYHSRSSRHQVFTRIIVGANMLQENISDHTYYFPWMDQWSSMTLAVFLEPNPVMAGYLRKRMGSLKEHGFSFGNLTIIQAALCANDSSSVPFYGISPRILDAFPDFHLNYTSMFHSLDKDWFLHAFRNYDFDRHGYPPERWDEALTYVEETPVRCLTASSLLQEIGKEAKDIDVLTVDAEGLDVELVTMFASMDDFFPALVAFEVFALRSINDHFVLNRFGPLVNLLAVKGLDVFQDAEFALARPPIVS